MMRTIVVVVALACAALASAGCPEPAEVGAIPGDTVKDVKARTHKAEMKLEQNANAAADAVKE